MLVSTPKAREPGNPPRRASNRHRKQGKGRMKQYREDAPDKQVGQPEEIVDNES